MKRSQARESAFVLVFESLFHADETSDEIYLSGLSYGVTQEDEYIREAFFGTREKMNEITEKINTASVGWKTDRMSKVSLSILSLAVYEMLYVDDVPYTVAINEALELAKKYDHDDARAFINGVLNKITENEGLKA